ncbi:MAG: maleylpyruvate isomerase N-terminal domain-containing protein [Thermocrispum sp.]
MLPLRDIPEQLDTRVPATPEWTARQVLAHLAGVATDAVHGRTEGRPGPTWTAPQVTQREGRALDDITAEWAQTAPAVLDAIATRRIHPAIVHDVLTHEAAAATPNQRSPSPWSATSYTGDS